MSKYALYKLKDMITNVEALAWSIGFIEFWVLMWLFVFSPSSPAEAGWGEAVVKGNIAMAYSFLGILSMSSAAVGLTAGMYRSSFARRFITKFGRLGPTSLVAEDFIGSIISVLFFVAVIFASVEVLSYARWGVLVVPNNLVGVFADLLLAGIILYWLAYDIAMALIVARRVRGVSGGSMTTLLVGFIVYAQLWISFGGLVYLIPLAPLPALLMYHSLGVYPPVGAYLIWLTGKGMVGTINLRLAALSSIGWAIALAAIAVLLTRKGGAVSVEEIGM